MIMKVITSINDHHVFPWLSVKWSSSIVGHQDHLQCKPQYHINTVPIYLCNPALMTHCHLWDSPLTTFTVIHCHQCNSMPSQCHHWQHQCNSMPSHAIVTIDNINVIQCHPIVTIGDINVIQCHPIVTMDNIHCNPLSSMQSSAIPCNPNGSIPTYPTHPTVRKGIFVHYLTATSIRCVTQTWRTTDKRYSRCPQE